MYVRLNFCDVDSFVTIDNYSQSLPSNIRIAEGSNSFQKLQNAIEVLMHCPEVNAVPILQDATDYSALIKELDSLACGRKMQITKKFESASQNETLDTTSRVEEFSKARRRSLNVNTGEACIQAISSSWNGLLGNVSRIGVVSALRSTLVYTPCYETPADGYIKSHIDHAGEMDFRLVECLGGSGTIFFADEDFNISAGQRIRTKVTAFELPPGSSSLFRTPSDYTDGMDAKACIHAHGIGGQNGNPERRLVIRHNLAVI